MHTHSTVQYVQVHSLTMVIVDWLLKILGRLVLIKDFLQSEHGNINARFTQDFSDISQGYIILLKIFEF